MSGAHPYRGVSAALATKHEKERIVAPLFSSLGISLQVPQIDTDVLGTFSGEIERVGTPKEVVLKKARMGIEALGLSYGLASEGSIGPDPVVPFLNSDIECVAWVDDERGIEIVEFHRSLDIIAATGSSINDEFLTRADFPNHSLIVKGNGKVVKGIKDRRELDRAIEEISALGASIVIESDLRAHHSPSRQRNIAAVAEKLVARLSRLCPGCSAPGFGHMENLYGVICRECKNVETRAVRGEVLGCAKCDYREEISNGKEFIEAAECGYCNP
jgi:hypothetical protein